ncbi:hypothetical protein CEUSTIGMA_g3466.t1 [Chlamydomonas eustigma]|uniref:Uncharacterized protein n=1 Tax=Chlamydomonas eustigma TaxID=1157962 RepID=A0A250WYU9_9CHLO|nr:hypothetical protein CEUSTIGMA_g3466.t1 [Chlamydomonas eustigma]|eukprot:GAX76023.1 hypothetical protein CEUSTIGMA_g3466.t1 [Chlamydomonas eustigma]
MLRCMQYKSLSHSAIRRSLGWTENCNAIRSARLSASSFQGAWPKAVQKRGTVIITMARKKKEQSPPEPLSGATDIQAASGRSDESQEGEPSDDEAQEEEFEEYEQELEGEEYEGLEYMEEEEEEEEEEMTQEEAAEMLQEATLLDSYFGIPTMVHFFPDSNGLTRCFLKNPYNESAAEIYLHGAAVSQWLRPNGEEALAYRQDTDFSGEGAIESGVKLCFPQYRVGGLPEDGFANKLKWEVVAAGLDFLPVPDGFRVRFPSNDELTAAMSKAEADQVAGNYVEEEDEQGGILEEGQEGEEETVGQRWVKLDNALFEREGEEDEFEEKESDEEADKKKAKLMRGAQRIADTDDYQAEVIEGFPTPGVDYDDFNPNDPLMDTMLPESEMDASTRLLKKYFDTGLDPAPYVTLRLKDSDQTRAMGWNHKFELLYKITLMEEDDYPDNTPKDMKATTPETTLTRISDEEQQRLMEVDAIKEEAGQSMISDPNEQDQSFADPTEAEAKANFKEVGKLNEVPMQLRLQLRLINEDPEGTDPMKFQVAHMLHIATKDMRTHGDFIRIRGLGGTNTIDYTFDDRTPMLGMCQEDYVYFMGQRIDATFVNAAEATVAVCPGDASHFELLPREGYKDMMVYHPGLLQDSSREDTESAATWGVLGCGRVSIPHELPPGHEWIGEFVVRFHNKNWEDPVWGDEGRMRPIAELRESQMRLDGNMLGVPDDENYGGMAGVDNMEEDQQ